MIDKIKKYTLNNFNKLSHTSKMVASGLKEGYITLGFVKETNELGYEVDEAKQIYVNRFGNWAVVERGVPTNLVNSAYPTKSRESRMLRELARCSDTKATIFSLLEKSDSRRKYFLPIKKGSGKITDDMIARAKEYPIEHIAEVKNERILCQWHADTDPSMKVYTKTNTAYCYSCNKFADSIDIYSKLNNCDFKTAVRELSK